MKIEKLDKCYDERVATEHLVSEQRHKINQLIKEVNRLVVIVDCLAVMEDKRAETKWRSKLDTEP